MEKFGNCWMVIFALQDVENATLNDFLENFFEVVCIDYQNEKLQYVGYLSKPVDEKLLKESAKSWGIVLPEYEQKFLPAENWLKKNVIKFPPLETEDFYIYGTHENFIPKNNKHKLMIYAATAFGSGQHKTTQLCLRLLSYLFHKKEKIVNILDMGCGSGILALSACKIWKNAKALCADIDDEAVIVAASNAKNNLLGEQIHTLQSNAFNNKKIIESAPYQLIFANILARPLIEMSQELVSCLQEGGYAILSGFIDEQLSWVKDEYEKHGLQLIKDLSDENWHAIFMEKKK